MIFVTLGTHHQPFDRLTDALALLPAAELVVQYGSSRPPTAAASAVPFMPFDELRQRMAEADVVVTHAGVGSILTARRAGHVPVVVPRRHDAGEHVDDHQLELTAALARQGSVTPVWDMSTLPGAVQAVPQRGQHPGADVKRLVSAVRSALLTDGHRSVRRGWPRR